MTLNVALPFKSSGTYRHKCFLYIRAESFPLPAQEPDPHGNLGEESPALPRLSQRPGAREKEEANDEGCANVAATSGERSAPAGRTLGPGVEYVR
ncbi:hypothetical protein SKAU_G00385740 [Synaphobranchus kaupii]|uniref:Uncharacterized protein n=1 Tax=Synaphobranchus kaupii TaxID=118154 RepID=A0A9Q1EEJ5_SYNKA|nr:hypothetical protein SKAU_G00385740 [Synaphobranchus kaupii]